MSSYQKEQAETLSMVQRHIATLSARERQELESEVTDIFRSVMRLTPFCVSISAMYARKSAIRTKLVPVARAKASSLFSETWLLMYWFLHTRRSMH